MEVGIALRRFVVIGKIVEEFFRADCILRREGILLKEEPAHVGVSGGIHIRPESGERGDGGCGEAVLRQGLVFLGVEVDSRCGDPVTDAVVHAHSCFCFFFASEASRHHGSAHGRRTVLRNNRFGRQRMFRCTIFRHSVFSECNCFFLFGFNSLYGFRCIFCESDTGTLRFLCLFLLVCNDQPAADSHRSCRCPDEPHKAGCSFFHFRLFFRLRFCEEIRLELFRGLAVLFGIGTIFHGIEDLINFRFVVVHAITSSFSFRSCFALWIRW